MDFRPIQTRVVFFLAVFGALLCVLLAASGFEGLEISTIASYAGMALILFATAGAFTRGTQWKWEVAFAFLFALLLLVVATAYLGFIAIAPALVLAVLLLAMLCLTYGHDVRSWFELESI